MPGPCVQSRSGGNPVMTITRWVLLIMALLIVVILVRTLLATRR